jgi:hypothetical protein
MSDPTLQKKATGAMTIDAISTVKFNVGGRLYEVPRALVKKFPSTMLARMASDTWQKRSRGHLVHWKKWRAFRAQLGLHARRQGVAATQHSERSVP